MLAQTDTEYSEVLNEMMILSGAHETYEAAINQMISMFKGQDNGNIPDKFWDELESEMKTSGVNELTKKLVPVYQKHFNIEDLKGMIEFYKTPLGKKYATKTPAITTESMQVGQIWGMELGEKIVKKLEEEGY